MNQTVASVFRTRLLPLAAMLVLALAAFLSPAQAADRDRIKAFLNVTGFDVALDSIALSAGSAPQMLGLQADDFGADWTRLTEEVFDTAIMRDIALDILEQTLSDENLDHAVEFYASDLGQRLVVVENASHLVEDDSAKQAEGQALVAGMVESGAPRLEELKRMNKAIDGTGNSLHALEEIQMRFLMSASAAGVIELQMSPEDMRNAIRERGEEMRLALQESALANAAYTYRDFSDEDVAAYADALEQPQMQNVYELLNAVQYEIMANRFEILAGRMADLHPGQDI